MMTRQLFQVTTHSSGRRLQKCHHNLNFIMAAAAVVLCDCKPLSGLEQPHRVRAAMDTRGGAHFSVGSVVGRRLNRDLVLECIEKLSTSAVREIARSLLWKKTN